MQTVTLLASELVSNAIRHASAESIELCFAVDPTHVRVEVADFGRGFTGELRPRNPRREGGWGLYIVDELASRWGVMEGSGTRVWFEIDR